MNTINSYINTDSFKWTAAIIGTGALAYTGYRVFSNLNKTIYDLNQSKQALENEKSALQERLANSTTQHLTFQAQNEALRGRANDLTTQLCTSQTENRTLQTRANDLTTQLSTSQTENRTLQTRAGDSETQRSILQRDLTIARTVIRALQAGVIDLREENQTLQGKVNNLTEQKRADARTKCTEQEKRIKGLISKVKKAEKATQAKDKALGGVLVSSLAYQKTAKESQSNNTILSSTISNQRSINRENQETIQSLRKENQRIEKDNQTYQNQIAHLQKRQASDSIKIYWLRSNIAHLQRVNAGLVPILQLPTHQPSKAPLIGCKLFGFLQVSVDSSPINQAVDKLLGTASPTSPKSHVKDSGQTPQPWIQFSSSLPSKLVNSISRT